MTRLPWPSRVEQEDGFTLIEVLLAVGVMFSALVVLAYTMLSGLTAVGFSRQRTEATALANQALEQLRALPSSQLFMSTTDISTDPTNLVSCGSNTCFNGRQVPLANFGANPTTTPLTPHISAPITAVPGNTQYTITTYLTYDPLDTNNHTLIATVQVSWSSSLKGGVANKVQVESKIYNTQFNEAPPGTHTFLANSSGGPGSIAVAATFLGNSVANVAFNIPSTSAGMGGSSLPNSTNVGTGTNVLGATTPVNASVAQSLVSAGAVNVLSTNAVSEPAVSAAGGPYALSPVGTSTPTILPGGASGLVGLTGSVGVTAAVGAKVTVQSVAASGAGGQTGVGGGTSPLPATSQGLGFGQAAATQTGVVSANLNLLLGLLNIGLVTLTPTGNGSPNIATVAQSGSPNTPESQVFNASATQQLSTISLLNLPVVGQVLTLTGFDQEAYACATPPPLSCTALPPVNSGSLTVLGQTFQLSQLLNPLSGTLTTVNNLLDAINVNIPLVAGITVTGGITAGSSASSSAGTATVPSPLAVNLAVHIALVGLSALTLNVTVNLGSVSASASYS